MDYWALELMIVGHDPLDLIFTSLAFLFIEILNQRELIKCA